MGVCVHVHVLLNFMVESLLHVFKRDGKLTGEGGGGALYSLHMDPSRWRTQQLVLAFCYTVSLSLLLCP